MLSPDSVCVRLGTGTEPLFRLRFGDEVPLAPLRPALAEDWHGRAEPRKGERDGMAFTEDGTWLMGQLRIAEPASDDIELAAFDAYQQLCDFLDTSPYPHLQRVWNFMDRLNYGEGDAERYRRFCVGRHRAIARPGFEARLPAATVIGSDQPGLAVCFLAAREPGVQIENPRQTSAFHYPRDYGPIAPSFSRATLVGRHLLVSGTAAVVGHVTLHPHQAIPQVDEIIANLAALHDNATRRVAEGPHGRWIAQALRLYVRNPADADAALARFRDRLDPLAPIAVLRGDISRADLVVEMEGVWTFDPAG